MKTRTGFIFLLIIIAIVAISVVFNTSQPSTPRPEIVKNGDGAFSDKNSPSTKYLPYSKSAFDNAKDKKRIYFFHANWCPTCKAANTEFLSKLNEIPDDIVLFKTDYDTEKELKKRYVITYQHTFVYVDQNGNELAKWNGGGVKELISNTLK